MPSHELVAWIELFTNIFTLLGIPVGIGVFIYEKKEERKLRQLESYFQSNDRYMKFLDRIFDHPDLNCGEFRATDDEIRTSGFSVQQLTLFTQLILILEQVWYLYHTTKLAAVDDSVWRTWEQTLRITGRNVTIFNALGK
jgi:hypothetical protein